MCGRYASFRQAQDLADVFDVSVVAEDVADVEPSWNVAPTDGVRVVLERLDEPTPADDAATSAADVPDGAVVAGVLDGVEPPPTHRELHVARWGLLPPWAKNRSAGAKMINARAETVAAKFTNPLRTKRCLVPADGYYEWQRPGPATASATKTPYFIHAADAGPLALAGVYSWWRDPAARAAGESTPWVLTCSILTAAAEGRMTELHDRVPVILPPGAVGRWLDPSVTDPAEALSVLAEPAPPLRWYEVSTAVNSVRNDGPDLVEPVA